MKFYEFYRMEFFTNPYLGFNPEIRVAMEVINYNKRYPESANMTQELFRESGGKIPEDSDLKSSFNWDSNYREHMCRNDMQRLRQFSSFQCRVFSTASILASAPSEFFLRARHGSNF